MIDSDGVRLADEPVYVEVDEATFKRAPETARYKLRGRNGWVYFAVDRRYEDKEKDT